MRKESYNIKRNQARTFEGLDVLNFLDESYGILNDMWGKEVDPVLDPKV